ncbi:MAG: response regulator [Myxococcales bacterium]
MNVPGPSVLVVDDEQPMRRFLRTALGAHGYTLFEASSAAEAKLVITTQNPSLVLLDLGLPDADGLELTRELREWSRVPIIVISARGREDDKVAALDAGADDYLTKPFGVNELLARIRVALRHARGTAQEESRPFELGGLAIDFTRRLVTVDSREIHLTPTEYKLLGLLARHAGKVLTHAQILKEVWGPNYANQTHYVRVHMAELRKKVEVDAARPQRILTEPGVGYRLRDR